MKIEFVLAAVLLAAAPCFADSAGGSVTAASPPISAGPPSPVATVGGSTLAEPVDLTRSSGPDTYFNRAGADMATHDRELRECMALAAKAQQPNTAFSASLVVNLILSEEQMTKSAQALSANTENCMVTRGWRVVKIPPEEADALFKLGQPDQAARLRNWVGNPTPNGVIVRQWTGELGGPGTIKFKSGSSSGRPSLSYTSQDWSASSALPKPSLRSSWDNDAPPAKPLAAADVAVAPQDQAVVIFHIVGASLHNGDNLVFQRVAADSGASVADERPDVLRGYDNPIWQKSGKWFAFSVPAGRWRLESIGAGMQIFELNLCLGSPAFDARAGEIIYAGTFDLDAADIGPDLALEPVKLWLGPQGGASGRVRPASYVNGSRGDCGGTYISSLEVKGAPYLDGYTWGGATRAQR